MTFTTSTTLLWHLTRVQKRKRNLRSDDLKICIGKNDKVSIKNKSKGNFSHRKYNFWRLRHELVGNYYSDGTLETLAVHLGLLKDYFRVLAGDPSHSRSVSGGQSECSPALFFLGLRFDLINSCRLIVECPFLGVSCCCIRWGKRFHTFLGHT